MPADNMMTMFREGGAKVKSGNGKETYKKQTQAGLMLDQQQMQLLVGGKPIEVKPFNDLIGVNDFLKHLEAAENAGFELLVKRAKVGMAKHVRVRPMFREWSLVGSFTVMDEEVSGLTEQVLRLILDSSGDLIAQGDRVGEAVNLGEITREQYLAGEGTEGDYPFLNWMFEESKLSRDRYYDYLRSHFYKFYNVPNWLAHMKSHYDFCFGTRFHGNMAGFMAGVPALLGALLAG